MAPELKNRQVFYLYGLTKAEPSAGIDAAGVDLKSRVQAIETGGVVAWISRVSAEEFEDRLASNMENLDWLASASVAHQRAIETIARHADILPARFATVFRTESSLRRHLQEHVTDIQDDFKRVAGADEWGVKVFANPRQMPPMREVRSGKDYLMSKAALLPQKGTQARANPELAEFQTALEAAAEDVAPAGNVSSGQRGLTFQTSLLVKRGNRKRFEAVLKKFSQRWAETHRIECTGPWPPYSFVSRRNEMVSAE
jgi:Gas vesicle synthesis protein GvpL/GvpF